MRDVRLPSALTSIGLPQHLVDAVHARARGGHRLRAPRVVVRALLERLAVCQLDQPREGAVELVGVLGKWYRQLEARLIESDGLTGDGDGFGEVELDFIRVPPLMRRVARVVERRMWLSK